MTTHGPDHPEVARRSTGRMLAPILLILLGVACLVYGYVFHVVPVAEKKTEPSGDAAPSGEASGVLSPDDPILAEGSQDSVRGDPSDEDWILKLTGGGEPSSAVHLLSEAELMREIARGGVERDASGTIRRTYSEEPPQACPT